MPVGIAKITAKGNSTVRNLPMDNVHRRECRGSFLGSAALFRPHTVRITGRNGAAKSVALKHV